MEQSTPATGNGASTDGANTETGTETNVESSVDDETVLEEPTDLSLETNEAPSS